MKVILVDDERLALEYLERQLMKLDHIEVIGKFQEPIAGRQEILSQHADIVFLDISLPEMNGIELAEQLLEQKPGLNIVFVTAYNEYAVKAFELNALDYILKPVRAERLIKTIDRIRARMELKQEKIIEKDESIQMKLFRQVVIEMSPGQYSFLQWRTSKAQELFLYLLQHHGQLVRKSILIELLWPEYELDKVYSQLYTAVYHIRKTLEPCGTRFQIVNTTEGYILNMEHVRLDVVEWETSLDTLPALSTSSIDKYIEVMKLYTGDYLQEYDYWWAESERQRLKGRWLQTSYAIADWYQAQGLLEKAVLVYQDICSHHPLEENAHFLLMKLYAGLEQPSSVHRQYSILTDALLNDLNETPGLHITRWYQQWASGGD